MVDEDLQNKVVKDLAFLDLIGMQVIIVHGGGPAISDHMKKVGLKPEFIKGQRKTDENTLEVVEMVLCGKVNNQIVKLINWNGAKAVGLSGKDANLIKARKLLQEVLVDGRIDSIDMGQVGEVESIDVSIIDILSNSGYIPVIAPIGVGTDNDDYNINADVLAAEVAISTESDFIAYLTDIDGLMKDPEDSNSLLKFLDVPAAKAMINNEVKGGMIPKVASCVKALENGVSYAFISNGTKDHALIRTLISPGDYGTTIRPGL
jgi:acetylglutamate kinase